MKRRLSLLLSVSLSLCLAVPLTSCSTTGGSSDTAAVLAGAGAQYLVAKDLAKAKTAPAWQARHDKWQHVLTVVDAVNKDGLTVEALTAIFATQLDPAEAALAGALVSLVPSHSATGALDLTILKSAATGLRTALAAPPPVFADK